MKRMNAMKGLLLTASIAVLLAAGAITVRAAGEHHHHGGASMGMGMWMGDDGGFLHQLDLTDAQKAQVKALHESQRAAMLPVHKQLMTAFSAIEDASTTPNFDAAAEARIRQIVSDNQETFTQAIIAHAKMHSELFKILTPEQQAKVTAMHQQMKEHMQHHMEEGHKTPSSQ